MYTAKKKNHFQECLRLFFSSSFIHFSSVFKVILMPFVTHYSSSFSYQNSPNKRERNNSANVSLFFIHLSLFLFIRLSSFLSTIYNSSLVIILLPILPVDDRGTILQTFLVPPPSFSALAHAANTTATGSIRELEILL